MFQGTGRQKGAHFQEISSVFDLYPASITRNSIKPPSLLMDDLTKIYLTKIIFSPN